MDIWLSPIIGLAGVVLGWSLNWYTTSFQERKRQAETRNSVRMLLRLECKQNLAALSEFWGKVTQVGPHLPDIGHLVGVGLSTDEFEFDKRQQLAREPLPAWRCHLWKSQAGMIAEALSTSEIDGVYSLYSDLEAFTAMRDELRKELNTTAGKQLAASYSDWMQQKERQHPTPGTGQAILDLSSDLRAFNERTRVQWSACESIHNRYHSYLNGSLIGEDALIPRFRDRLIHWFRKK